MKKLDCYQGLKLTHSLLYGGLGLMVLGLMLGVAAEFSGVMEVLAILGVVLVAVGLICGWMFVKCPHCGCYPGELPRMLSKLPKHCPDCGGQL